MSARPSLNLIALPPAARACSAALRGISRASLLLLLVALVRANDPPLTAAALAEAIVLFALLPELCARFVLRAFAAIARVEHGALVIERADQIVRVPIASIADVVAWRLPLPSAGVSLRLRSGARLPMRLALADPAALLRALAAHGCAAASRQLSLARVRYASARAARAIRWWDRWPARVLFLAFVPACVGFYAHQRIAFGALLGEYTLMGPRAWLATAAEHYVTSVLYLALWSAAWRAATELASFLAPHAAPASAASARVVSERTATLLYYASVPTLLALRFLA